MKTITFTTLGIAALMVAGAFSSGCSSASTGTTGTGGSGGSATGNGGASGAGGAGGGSGNDAAVLGLCDSTVKDNGPCTPPAADCNKTCGISASGALKPCTCSALTSTWDCGLGTCAYPSTFDHTCYVRPATPPACPALTQSNMTTCTPTTTCTDTICSGYVDSTGTPKTGFCACTGMKSVDGGAAMNVYLCASTAEWPPQQ